MYLSLELIIYFFLYYVTITDHRLFILCLRFTYKKAIVAIQNISVFLLEKYVLYKFMSMIIYSFYTFINDELKI